MNACMHICALCICTWCHMRTWGHLIPWNWSYGACELPRGCCEPNKILCKNCKFSYLKYCLSSLALMSPLRYIEWMGVFFHTFFCVSNWLRAQMWNYILRSYNDTINTEQDCREKRWSVHERMHVYSMESALMLTRKERRGERAGSVL